MEKINQLLGDQSSLRSMMKDVEFGHQLKANWASLFGDLASDIQFHMVRGLSLYVNVLNPMWLTEIKFYKPQILEKIKAQFKTSKIRDIVIRSEVTLVKVVMPSKNEGRENLTFEEKIKRAEAQEKASGKQMCTRCHEQYTFESLCVDCKADLSLRDLKKRSAELKDKK